MSRSEEQAARALAEARGIGWGSVKDPIVAVAECARVCGLVEAEAANGRNASLRNAASVEWQECKKELAQLVARSSPAFAVGEHAYITATRLVTRYRLASAGTDALDKDEHDLIHAIARELSKAGQRKHPLAQKRQCPACGKMSRITTAGCDHCNLDDK